MTQLLRILQVADRVGLSKTEIYRRVRAGTFPRQHRISHKVAVWRSDEIDAWILAVASGDEAS